MIHLSRDLIKYLPAQIIPSVIAFISVPLFTRLLTPGEFGEYAIVMSSVAVLAAVLSWLNASMLRFYPSLPEDEVPILVRTSFWTKLAFSLGIGLLGLASTYVFAPQTATLRLLAAAGIMLFISQSLFTNLTMILRARLEASLYSLFVIIAKAAGLGLGLILVAGFRAGAIGIILGMLVGFALPLPLLIARAFAGEPVLGRVSTSLLRPLARYGVPLTVGNVAAWGLSRVDRYLIAAFYSSREVGLYSATYSIAEHSIMILNTLFLLSAGPLLVQAWEKEGQEASRRLLTSTSRLYLLIVIPAAAGIAYLAEPLLRSLLGQDFGQAHQIVPWVVAGVVLLGLEQRYWPTLTLTYQSEKVMWVMLASVLANVGLNWLLLPRFGFQIAAVTSTVSYLLLFLGVSLWSRRAFRWPFPWKTAWRVGAATAAMLAGLYLIDSIMVTSDMVRLLTLPPAGAALYAISLSVLKEIGGREFRAALSLFRPEMAQDAFARREG